MAGFSCSEYEGASTVNLAFAILITFGIFLSYIPQYRRIYLKKSSEGLSTQFLFLGSASSIFTFTNIILISSKARKCCFSGEISGFNCLNALLNLIQIGIQCTCAIMILVFVLYFTNNSIKQDKAEYSRIVTVGKLVLIHIILSILQIIIGLNFKSYLYAIANLNGLLSALLTIIKYVPQIWTTYHLKHPGTLSIGMMCIQTPGGFVFTATLFFTKGSHWSSWVSYLVAALLQGSLLSLCIYYQYFQDSGIIASMAEREVIERIVAENERELISDQSEESDALLERRYD